jgi:hypothetical protein
MQTPRSVCLEFFNASLIPKFKIRKEAIFPPESNNIFFQDIETCGARDGIL